MSKYIPNIGDVVIDNDIAVVVVKMVSYEDVGSCSYDRKYLLCEENYIRDNQGIITMKDLENNGRWVTIRGMEFPDIQKPERGVPYKINNVEALNITQKTAKTVTVYE